MFAYLVRFLKSEEGPTSVEYAIMLAMVLMAVIGSITVIGSLTDASFDYSRSEIERTFPPLAP